MTRDELITLARATAQKHSLDPTLVCAVAHHESNDWNPWATRFEPGFLKRYIEPMGEDVPRFGTTISKDTERRDRATSFGLMQVMGQVAREYGFRGEYLSELLTPELALEYGCQRLARALRAAGFAVRPALLRYNGGSDPKYPDLVLAHIDAYTVNP